MDFDKIARNIVSGYTADDLYDSIMRDEWPRMAAQVDFGLDTPNRVLNKKRYEALYYPVRAGEIDKSDLRRVVGDGPAITKLVSRCRSNPHKGIVFETSWDDMGDEDDGMYASEKVAREVSREEASLNAEFWTIMDRLNRALEKSDFEEAFGMMRSLKSVARNLDRIPERENDLYGFVDRAEGQINEIDSKIAQLNQTLELCRRYAMEIMRVGSAHRASEKVAIDFDTKEQMDEYLKEHPVRINQITR